MDFRTDDPLKKGKTSSVPMMIFVLANLAALYFFEIAADLFPLSPGMDMWLIFSGIFFIFALHALIGESRRMVMNPSARTITGTRVNLPFVRKKVCFKVG